MQLNIPKSIRMSVHAGVPTSLRTDVDRGDIKRLLSMQTTQESGVVASHGWGVIAWHPRRLACIKNTRFASCQNRAQR